MIELGDVHVPPDITIHSGRYWPVVVSCWRASYVYQVAKTVFGPPAAAEVISDAIAPLKDLGVLGANTTRNRRAVSSDHSAFIEAGLPGIGDIHDPIHYESHTWHSNLDTYERIVEEDAIKSAIATAAAVYHLAMRPDRLPRLPDADMPPPPQR